MKSMICSITLLLLFGLAGPLYAQYDEKYVSTSTEVIDGEVYTVVEMTRLDERVRVKYFADATQGRSVYNRYLNWSKNKSIIAASSGTYFSEEKVPRPVGICIDEGTIINKTEYKMDALVIVYKTGGVVVSNLKEGNLTVKDDSGPLSLNLKNPIDRVKFFNWSVENSATVFQTHLLYYKNKLQIAENSSANKRERRFLIAAIDDQNVVRYYMVNLKGYNTLYNASLKVLKYIQDYTDNIVYMINLDTGAQDYYEVRESNGTKKATDGFKGNLKIEATKNLLVFYFE
jgi:hypothetical protein